MRRKNDGCANWRPAVMDQPTGFFMLHRFQTEGIEGLGDRPKSGRPRRLTAEDDSRIIAPVRQAPPGRLERRADEMVARDEEGSGKFRLDALAQAAGELGIAVKRSQIRRICLREGVRWRRTHSWGTSPDKDFVAIWTAVVCHYTQPPAGSTTVCTDELGPVVPRSFPPAPGWSPTGHRIKAVLEGACPAQFARGVVAALPSRCVGWAKLCRC